MEQVKIKSRLATVLKGFWQSRISVSSSSDGAKTEVKIKGSVFFGGSKIEVIWFRLSRSDCRNPITIVNLRLRSLLIMDSRRRGKIILNYIILSFTYDCSLRGAGKDFS
jgi:hypothetical protein